MDTNYINGSNLMLFIKDGSTYKSIAAATNHTMSLDAEMADISNKDTGKWGAQIGKKINWSITTDNLFTFNKTDGKYIIDIYNNLVNFTSIDVVFSLNNGYTDTYATVPAGGWTPTTPSETTPQWSGKVNISNLQITAQNGETATFTATFTGVGPLVLNNGAVA